MYKNNLLSAKDASLLVVNERNNNNVIIASPHHTPIGTSGMPCVEHRNGDEAAGFLANYIADKLDLSSVVASNYFIDANKDEEYDYFRIIEKWNPNFLIEIHGHGSRSAVYDIEISCGSENDNEKSVKMADELKRELSNTSLSKYSISGDYNKIYFTAQYSATIITDKWTSYHIELPNKIRTDEKEAKTFCDALVRILEKLYPDHI